MKYLTIFVPTLTNTYLDVESWSSGWSWNTWIQHLKSLKNLLIFNSGLHHSRCQLLNRRWSTIWPLGRVLPGQIQISLHLRWKVDDHQVSKKRFVLSFALLGMPIKKLRLIVKRWWGRGYVEPTKTSGYRYTSKGCYLLRETLGKTSSRAVTVGLKVLHPK